MKIIVNADDYGLSKGVNLGILEGMRNGVVTSTTMMANGWAFEHGVDLYKKSGDLKVGVHLNLTWGRPISRDLKTLVSEDGSFLHRSNLFDFPEKFDQDEIKKELMAQISKVRESGIKITHLDSHHHAHKIPVVAEIVADIANSLGVSVRPVAAAAMTLRNAGVETPEHFTQDFYDKNVTTEGLIALFDHYEGGTLEIMCHPAYIDQQLMDATAYNMMRARELKILCSEEIKEAIGQRGIRLADYRNYK